MAGRQIIPAMCSPQPSLAEEVQKSGLCPGGETRENLDPEDKGCGNAQERSGKDSAETWLDVEMKFKTCSCVRE